MRKRLARPRTEELQHLVHELRVHQLELERQSEAIRQTQRELEAERERVADLYQLTAVAHLTLDRAGTIVEATVLAVALLGVNRGRLTRRRVHELVVPEDWAALSAHLADVFGGAARHTCDLRFVTGGNTVRVVRVSSVAGPDAGGQSTRCRTALMDITERRRAEEGLEGTRAQFETIVNSALDAIVTVGGEGAMVLMNPAAERMFGCKAGTVIGHLFDRFVGESSRMWYRSALTPGADREVGGLVSGRLGEMVARRADGTEFPVEVSISEVGGAGGPLFTVILRDVSARRQAEREVAERLRLEQLVTRLTLAFGHVSTVERDLEIRRGLREAADFLRVDRGGLIEFLRDGTVARCWATTDDWLNVGEVLWMTALLQRGGVVTVSRLEDCPDDAVVDRQRCLASGVWRLGPGRDPAGEGRLVGALVFGPVAAGSQAPDDLTRYLHRLGEVFASLLFQEQSEVERQKLRQDLWHLNRVATIGELTASLAHELNQPLAAILSNAQAAQLLMKGDPMDAEQVREILRDIAEDDKRAAAVIHRLRGLLKKGDAEFTVLDVNELVDEVARLIRSDAAVRGVAIRLDLDPALPPTMGDRVRLQQVLINLALNGMDAMREPWTGERVLVFGTAREGPGGIRIMIRDSGVGVGGDDLERMLEPFYTTKADGMGMGLAISRSILEVHGARLDVASNPEGGTTFSFTLPVRSVGP